MSSVLGRLDGRPTKATIARASALVLEILRQRSPLTFPTLAALVLERHAGAAGTDVSAALVALLEDGVVVRTNVDQVYELYGLAP